MDPVEQTIIFSIYISSVTVPFLPAISEIKNSTINKKNKNLAMPAAPAAIPPKPKIAAMMATIKNITVQRNITYNFKVKKLFIDVFQ